MRTFTIRYADLQPERDRLIALGAASSCPGPDAGRLQAVAHAITAIHAQALQRISPEPQPTDTLRVRL